VIADSDLVVRGSISEVTATFGWARVALKVTETLKGPPQDEVTFLVCLGSSGPGYLNEKKGRELIYCLVSSDHYLKYDPGFAASRWAIRARYDCVPDWWFGIIDPTARPPWDPIVTMDLRILTRWEEVLASARQAAASPPGDPAAPTHRIDFSDPSINSIGSTSLTVPVNGQLEEYGQRWVESPNAFFRQEGARALRHFKSQGNIRLITKLLSDPNFCLETRSDCISKKRVYSVRKAAYETLVAWGIHVPQPTLEESALLPRGALWQWFVGVTAAVLICFYASRAAKPRLAARSK
jgi:hypothetical protein